MLSNRSKPAAVSVGPAEEGILFCQNTSVRLHIQTNQPGARQPLSLPDRPTAIFAASISSHRYNEGRRRMGEHPKDLAILVLMS
jgi:hypothetical protein